jgi:Abortive infection alpha
MSEISESAKAIQEVAKIANQGIAAGQQLGSFVAKLIGEPLEVASGMLSDRLKFARAERLLRLKTRFDEETKRRGVSEVFRGVSPKFVLPLLENASLEGDDELQDLWANLLASSVDPSFDGSIRVAYIDILRQLEVIDVHVLQSIYGAYEQAARFQGAAIFWPRYVSDNSPASIAIQSRGVIENLDIDADLYENSIDNLVRLRCVSPFIETKLVHADGGRQMIEMYDDVTRDHGYVQICMTALGVSFVRACLGKSNLQSTSSGPVE